MRKAERALQEIIVKPGGHGGQCKRIFINRSYTFIFRSRCAEV